MKILAFAASNNQKSINKELVSFSANIIAKEVDAKVDLIDINEFEMPLYRQDREEENGIPKEAHKFFELITNADLIMISFAEHNGSYTAAYKNLFDWTSRINMKVYQDKKVILLSSSPGKGGASSVLNQATTSAPYFGMNLLESISLPEFYTNFDMENKKVKSEDFNNKLKDLAKMLVQT